jgi:prepilin-type N-terminal cleavage/methylation domain-containing protein
MSIKSYSLLELMVASVILGILVALSVPAYQNAQERSWDKEATSILMLMRSAEIMYKMDRSVYYPATGSSKSTSNSTDLDDINSKLRLSLTAYQAKWIYTIANTGGTAATVSISAKRNRTSGTGRTWSLTVDSEIIGCSPGAGDSCL